MDNIDTMDFMDAPASILYTSCRNSYSKCMGCVMRERNEALSRRSRPSLTLERRRTCDRGEGQSTDRGKTWRKLRTLTRGDTLSHNHVKTVRNHELSDGQFRVMWSCGDGQSPPDDTGVTLYYFGEGMDAPRQIEASQGWVGRNWTVFAFA